MPVFKVLTVLKALIGLTQLLDGENHGVKEQPPYNTEPLYGDVAAAF
jgi:hypothetical protein